MVGSLAAQGPTTTLATSIRTSEFDDRYGFVLVLQPSKRGTRKWLSRDLKNSRRDYFLTFRIERRGELRGDWVRFLI